MSVEQYQKAVNSLDKDIAVLEKKKATLDKKAAEEQRKAANITISKNASATTIKSKLKQRDAHLATANKASNESATIAKKIADKRKKRNDAAVQLQKEAVKVQKKQDKVAKQMQQSYEKRIEELQMRSVPVALPENSEKECFLLSMMCLFPMLGKIKRNSLTNL